MSQHIDPDLLLELRHTRRKFRPNRRLVGGAIVFIAAFDVLVLFTAFVLDAQVVGTRPGLTLELPQTTSRTEIPIEGAMVLTVTKEGLYYFEDQRIPDQGLDDAFRKAVFESPTRRLVLYADSSFDLDRLHALISRAQAAGIEKIVMLGQDPLLPAPVEPTP